MKLESTHNASPGGPRTLRQRIVLVALIAVCGLVGAELAARLASSLFRQRVMTYDAVVGWRPIPNSEVIEDAGYGSYHVAINSKGLRDSEHEFEKAEGIYRVVVLGDSITFGYGGVEQSELFTEILEDRLAAVEFINLGVPGFSTDQEYHYLKEHGLKYDPDLVLLSMYQDDFFPTFESFIPIANRPKGYVRTNGDELAFHAAKFPWHYLLAENSVLVGFAESKFKFVRQLDRIPDWDVTLTLNQKLDTFKLVLAEIRDLCMSRGVKFAMVLQPGFMLAEEDDYTRRIATEFAADNAVDMLDLNNAPPFQAPDAATTFGVGDNIHLNSMAHQLIADLLQDFLARTPTLQDVFKSVSADAAGSGSRNRN